MVGISHDILKGICEEFDIPFTDGGGGAHREAILNYAEILLTGVIPLDDDPLAGIAEVDYVSDDVYEDDHVDDDFACSSECGLVQYPVIRRGVDKGIRRL
jgi:hypothetical protein